MTAPTEREHRKSRRSSLPRADDETAGSLIESEIVIVDDDGTEEPFDPASWFK
ncbi:hypothetical protein [Streptomyces sp. NPDC096012]|uniref:hypothetical protein n=1 Tax=Streptomyces sp. NPDC096012 TaxID=3155684 RepID=UPI00336A63BC